jgi:hypothetical protein
MAKGLIVSTESILVGFAIGTSAHLLGEAFGFGLSLGTLGLAGFVGGIPGALVGLVVGLVVYYGILRDMVTWKHWAMLIGVAFFTATIAFLPLGRLTFFITPIVTLTAALILRFRACSTAKLL